jgi:hypothetical protein
MWVETKIIMDGGYQEVVIQENETQNAIVLRVVERQEMSIDSRLYMSYDEAIRLANELIEFVGKAKM